MQKVANISEWAKMDMLWKLWTLPNPPKFGSRWFSQRKTTVLYTVWKQLSLLSAFPLSMLELG